jgi:predicted nicotinamide N-methyase
MEAIHRCGVSGLSLTFGNIIIDEKETAWFLDFEGAKAYGSVSNPIFRYRRDRDRIKFNEIYHCNLMTEKSAREMLEVQMARFPLSYAPIDFGNGLAIGGFWSIDSGTGRWEYLNKHVLGPLIRGKRVLDLGSNNGVMPIMMLRGGAEDVVGVEIDQSLIKWAELIKEIFEWRDMRKYSFRIQNSNMLEILRTDREDFDVVTAFCSLYYLSETDMVYVVRRASELASTIVVQAKTNTRPEAPENKAKKSSVPFLRELLQENGFPDVRLFDPDGFTRPLLVGRTTPQVESCEGVDKICAAGSRFT